MTSESLEADTFSSDVKGEYEGAVISELVITELMLSSELELDDSSYSAVKTLPSVACGESYEKVHPASIAHFE